MDHDPLTDYGKVSLDRLKLAADVILRETDALTDGLEVELPIDRTSGRHADGEVVPAVR